MKFELKPYHRNVLHNELIDDLKRVALELEKDCITLKEYNRNGKYSCDIFQNRFGTWNKALIKAGLKISNRLNISKEELFENLEEVWIKLGRQPQKRDLIKPISKISESPYINKFGSWRKALESFVKEMNNINDPKDYKIKNNNENDNKSKISRDINWRLRFLVMRRDNFKCIKCGRSPATHIGAILHIDHKKAWSEGGETVFENLQTLCQECNIGKSNLSDKEEWTP